MTTYTVEIKAFLTLTVAAGSREEALAECRERASYLSRYHAKVRVRKLKSWSAN